MSDDQTITFTGELLFVEERPAKTIPGEVELKHNLVQKTKIMY